MYPNPQDVFPLPPQSDLHPTGSAGRISPKRAVDSVIAGDRQTLERLLRDDPGLVHARSSRQHRATLLHYVSANGVENYRQATPPNILEIARLLLDAGAEVNAEAEMYGGGATTFGLTMTSAHPPGGGAERPCRSPPRPRCPDRPRKRAVLDQARRQVQRRSERAY